MIGATISFPAAGNEGDAFVWSNDALMPPSTTAYGVISERKGNKMTLDFGPDSANAFFQMAQIPDSGDKISDPNADVKIKYKAQAFAAKDKMKVEEKVSFTVTMAKVPVLGACKFKWTVTRALKSIEPK